ncbi:uncharacterized protein BO88DRAFT_361583, partial [Aspergillus vadensis CBS 113365]
MAHLVVCSISDHSLGYAWASAKEFGTVNSLTFGLTVSKGTSVIRRCISILVPSLAREQRQCQYCKPRIEKTVEDICYKSRCGSFTVANDANLEAELGAEYEAKVNGYKRPGGCPNYAASKSRDKSPDCGMHGGPVKTGVVCTCTNGVTKKTSYHRDLPIDDTPPKRTMTLSDITNGALVRYVVDCVNASAPALVTVTACYLSQFYNGLPNTRRVVNGQDRV